MIRVHQRSKIIHLLLATLFGVMAMSYGGVALAATAPLVRELQYTYINEKGETVEVKMNTGARADGLAVDSKGNVYVTDSTVQRVYVFNSNARLVNVFSNVKVPVGVGVDEGAEGNLTVYVNGNNQDGRNAILLLDRNGGIKGFFADGGVQELSNDIIVTDSSVYLSARSGVVKIFSKNGLPVKDVGPFIETYDSEVINGTTYTRTMHTYSFAGIAVDEAANEIYISAREAVKQLRDTSCASISNPKCYEDTTAYNYYTPADPKYKHWYPLADRYRVIVVDKQSGKVKNTLIVMPSTTGAQFVLDGESSTTILPVGLALDNKGRLFVAATDGIKVYDRATGAQLSVSGTLKPGVYTDVDYRPDTASGGWLYAISENVVSVYSVDGSVNPANTPPTAPALIAPNGTYAASTPVLEIANASDREADPLTYGYEIKDSSGSKIITSASGIKEGANGKTSATVNTTLGENTLYRWRAQAYDGNAATWSGEAEFCANDRNDNPAFPAIISPKGEAVSPFSSSLSWSASTDPDCYDTVSYTVEVSNNSGFLTTVGGIGGTSLSLGSIKGLVNGGTYSWRVKAVDNNGGESAYSVGSFVYRTTVIKFESNQSNTKVYIDGNYGYPGRLLGTTPREDLDITPGSHLVTFVKAGYEPFYAVVNIPDPLSIDGKVTVVVNGKVSVVDDGKVYASMVKASKIRPSSTGVERVKINGGSATPFVVDYNNDGFKDVIAGGKVNVYNAAGALIDVIDGKVYLFLAQEQLQVDGTKKVVLIDSGALKADGADINAGSRAVPFIVDYNNDGRKDLLVGSGDGFIYLYLNTGAENDPVFALAGTVKDGSGLDIKVMNSAPFVVDYNNDGRKDLVVGSIDGMIRLYKNTGTDAFPEFDPLYETIKADNSDLNVGSNSRPFFTDWNSDGKKDLVVGRGIADSEGNTVNLLFNIGTDDAPSFVTISGLKSWIKEKKRIRGNREFIPYLGYNNDLGDLTAGNGEASPFVVNWDDSSARDLVVGNGGGGIGAYQSVE